MPMSEEWLGQTAGPMAEALARRRVPLGFICGILVLWLSRPTSRSLIVGGLIATAGEILRIWAAGHLEKGREVTQSGPYRLTRHPLYVGSLIIGVGAAIASARVSGVIVIVLYLAMTIASAMRTEEAAMRSAFREQYDAYLQSQTASQHRPFSLQRAIRNKEHRAVAGLAVAAAILAVKVAFR
jgi:protein-S-isoprenylcysteine O-methyltransferase Ste14